jgi:hypothetical protein
MVVSSGNVTICPRLVIDLGNVYEARIYTVPNSFTFLRK